MKLNYRSGAAGSGLGKDDEIVGDLSSLTTGTTIVGCATETVTVATMRSRPKALLSLGLKFT